YTFFFTCLLLLREPLRPTLFPYTTLFRSNRRRRALRFAEVDLAAAGLVGLVREPLSVRRQTCIVHVPRTARHGLSLSRRQIVARSEEHTSELQSRFDLVYRPLPERQKLHV